MVQRTRNMATDQSAKAPWYIDAVKTLGVPTVFLFCVLYMLWVSGQWAGTTILLPLYTKQSQFIDSATKMTEKMMVTTDEINRTLKAHGENAVENLRVTNSLHKATETCTSAIIDCHKQVQASQDLIREQAETNKEHQKNVLDVLKKIETNTEQM